jgi:TatD DNase family protein
LDFPDFAGDLPEVLDRAQAAGVERILTIGTSLESSRRAVELAQRYPMVYAVVGVHPCHAHEEEFSALDEIAGLLRADKVLAIGEAGLDYYRLGESLSPEEVARRQALQADFFHAQLEIARAAQRNIVLHQRAAWKDTLTILEKFTAQVSGVFHCFGGTLEEARQVLALGHKVSFTGIITFKNAALVRETARALPPGSFFVETDCPYLAPVPDRGKRCEPAHACLVAQTLAQIRQTSLAELAQETTSAACKFFNLPTT